VNDLGYFAQHDNALGSPLDLGSGPWTPTKPAGAPETRYFAISLQFPTGAADALQGTTANFTLHWYGHS
jgi:hypothetical protein